MKTKKVNRLLER